MYCSYKSVTDEMVKNARRRTVFTDAVCTQLASAWVGSLMFLAARVLLVCRGRVAAQCSVGCEHRFLFDRVLLLVSFGLCLYDFAVFCTHLCLSNLFFTPLFAMSVLYSHRSDGVFPVGSLVPVGTVPSLAEGTPLL